MNKIDSIYSFLLKCYQLLLIRLILPVSHLLVKRLIHACVWHGYSACRRLIKTKITYPPIHSDNFANCEANT